MKIYAENGPRVLHKGSPGIDSIPEEVYMGFCECPVCGRCFAVAPRYPFFNPHVDGSKDLKSLWRRRNAYRQTKRTEDFWQWYDEFRRRMAEERPDIHYIPPGTSFGPLRLNVEHPLQLAHGNGTCLIARSDVVEGLKSRGIQLKAYPTLEGPRRRRGRSEVDLELFSQDQTYQKSGYSFYELFAPAAARLVLPNGMTFCDRCQRCENSYAGNWDPPRPVLRSSIPVDLDLFVSFERPGMLLATERFVEATADFESDPYVMWRELEVQ